MTYLHNLRAWLTGFSRFGELSFKSGWSADSWKWRLLYAFDYGSHTLTGGDAEPVVFVSELSDLQRRLLKLLGVSLSDYRG